MVSEESEFELDSTGTRRQEVVCRIDVVGTGQNLVLVPLAQEMR